VSLDQSDIELALGLADAADVITGARFRANDLTIDRKPDRTPVTDADLAVEDRIRELLSQARPGDQVAGEERGGQVGAGRTWLIDPVDGTKNFLRGVPAWATLIALLVDGTPVVGVATAPALGRRWWAADGFGAWTSAIGVPAPWRVSVSGVDDLGDAYLSTTDLNSWAEHHTREAYLRLVDACWESRAFGDFWQHCMVAEGALDVAAEAVVSPWDVAALQVIVEQAGGRFTDLHGRTRHDGGSALSTNGRVHDSALATLGPPPQG
jgi:histidinol-phosphatase